MDKMTATQVINCAKACLEQYKELTNYRIKQAGKITGSEDKELDSKQNDLFDLATELNAKAVLLTVKDLKDPAGRIDKATTSIDKALKRLEKVRNVIGAIGSLVEVVTSLVTAIKTGSLASIAPAINNIEKLVGTKKTALRTSTTRSITVTTPGSSPMRAGAAAVGKELAVPLIAQKRSNWCWAACAEMVTQFYGNSALEQWDFVNRYEGKTICDNLRKDFDKDGRLCNRGIRPPAVRPSYFVFGIDTLPLGPKISANDLKLEIRNGRPVQLMLMKSSGEGHVVLVHGWVAGPSEPLFWVNDPGPANTGTHRRVKYSDLENGFGIAGSWTKTWTGIKKR